MNSQSQSKQKDYELIQELGDGAYGKVYRCVNRTDQQEYALKMISKRHMKLNKKEHHVYIEKDMLLMLNHPGIAKLYRCMTDADNLYFVLELVPESLSAQMSLHSLKIPFKTIAFYTAEILLVLEYIHSVGVIHRDLKPDNLLISKDKHIKLIDFGTSAIYDESLVQQPNKIKSYIEQFYKGDYNRQHEWVGTLTYLSPEMILDQDIGPSSDLWALGCICYKMFTGTLPFMNQDEDKLLKIIVENPVEFPKTVPNVAADFISQLLIKDQHKRLQDYAQIKLHPFFDGIDFNDMWNQKPPDFGQRQVRKSKTFIHTPITMDIVIHSEMVEKDSGFLINYFTPRFLVLKLVDQKPVIYYTNPKLNDKKTTIKINEFFQYQLLKNDKFVLTDDQKKKYIFKVQFSLNRLQMHQNGLSTQRIFYNELQIQNLLIIKMSYSNQARLKRSVSPVLKTSSQDRKNLANDRESYIQYLETQLEKVILWIIQSASIVNRKYESRLCAIEETLSEHDEKFTNFVKLIKLLQHFAETQEQENSNIREQVNQSMEQLYNHDLMQIKRQLHEVEESITQQGSATDIESQVNKKIDVIMSELNETALKVDLDAVKDRLPKWDINQLKNDLDDIRSRLPKQEIGIQVHQQIQELKVVLDSVIQDQEECRIALQKMHGQKTSTATLPYRRAPESQQSDFETLEPKNKSKSQSKAKDRKESRSDSRNQRLETLKQKKHEKVKELIKKHKLATPSNQKRRP